MLDGTVTVLAPGAAFGLRGKDKDGVTHRDRRRPGARRAGHATALVAADRAAAALPDVRIDGHAAGASRRRARPRGASSAAWSPPSTDRRGTDIRPSVGAPHADARRASAAPTFVSSGSRAAEPGRKESGVDVPPEPASHRRGDFLIAEPVRTGACLVAGCTCKDARIVSHRRAAFFAAVARQTRARPPIVVIAPEPGWHDPHLRRSLIHHGPSNPARVVAAWHSSRRRLRRRRHGPRDRRRQGPRRRPGCHGPTGRRGAPRRPRSALLPLIGALRRRQPRRRASVLLVDQALGRRRWPSRRPSLPIAVGATGLILAHRSGADPFASTVSAPFDRRRLRHRRHCSRSLYLAVIVALGVEPGPRVAAIRRSGRVSAHRPGQRRCPRYAHRRGTRGFAAVVTSLAGAHRAGSRRRRRSPTHCARSAGALVAHPADAWSSGRAHLVAAYGLIRRRAWSAALSRLPRGHRHRRRGLRAAS